MALKDCHDMPNSPCKSYHDVTFLLRYGKLYIHDAIKNNEWRQVKSLDDIKGFKKEYSDNYDNIVVTIKPYLPEFYYVPTSWRGVRHIRRARNRALKRR